MEYDRNHMLAADEPPSYTQSHLPHNTQPSAAPAGETTSVDNDRGNTHGTMSQEPLTRQAEPVEPVEERSQTTATTWPSSNPFVSYYRPPHGSPITRSARGVDSPGAMDLDDSRGVRGGSVFSIDDPDVRLAAEALGDLRAGM